MKEDEQEGNSGWLEDIPGSYDNHGDKSDQYDRAYGASSMELDWDVFSLATEAWSNVEDDDLPSFEDLGSRKQRV